MYQIILESLIRQAKGTQLLGFLLREEYALLRAGKPDEVAGLEITVQELIRQLVRDREFLVRQLQGAGFDRLGTYYESLEAEERRQCEKWQATIVANEQESARQSGVNAELAMALWKQSGVLLKEFHNKVAPRERNTYTAKGAWQSRPTTATLVRGRI